MRDFSVRVAGIMFSLMLIFSVAHAAGAGVSQFSARVRVVVDAEDNMRKLVTSHINRELRSLHDVIIVNVDPRWELHVVAVEVSTWGRDVGVALSAVMFECFDNQILGRLFQPNYRNFGTRLTLSLCHHPVYLLQVGPTNELKRLCQAVVADFDAKRLEPSRKTFLQNTETVKKKNGEGGRW